MVEHIAEGSHAQRSQPVHQRAAAGGVVAYGCHAHARDSQGPTHANGWRCFLLSYAVVTMIGTIGLVRVSFGLGCDISSLSTPTTAVKSRGLIGDKEMGIPGGAVCPLCFPGFDGLCRS